MTSPPLFPRSIDIFVRDRNGLPIPGAQIRFTVNGVPAGDVINAEGRGRIQLATRDAEVGVSVTYAGVTKAETLSKSQDTYTFNFDVSVGSEKADYMERHVALVVGLVLIAAAIALAFAFPSPTTLQSRVVLGTFSLAGGAIATEIGGMLKVDLTLGTKLAIGATGALAVFVILYLVVPA